MLLCDRATQMGMVDEHYRDRSSKNTREISIS